MRIVDLDAGAPDTLIYAATLAPSAWAYRITMAPTGQQQLSLEHDTLDLVPHFVLCCMGPRTFRSTSDLSFLPLAPQLAAVTAQMDMIRARNPADYEFLATTAQQWAKELCLLDWANKGFPRTDSVPTSHMTCTFFPCLRPKGIGHEKCGLTFSILPLHWLRRWH